MQDNLEIEVSVGNKNENGNYTNRLEKIQYINSLNSRDVSKFKPEYEIIAIYSNHTKTIRNLNPNKKTVYMKKEAIGAPIYGKKYPYKIRTNKEIILDSIDKTKEVILIRFRERITIKENQTVGDNLKFTVKYDYGRIFEMSPNSLTLIQKLSNQFKKDPKDFMDHNTEYYEIEIEDITSPSPNNMITTKKHLASLAVMEYLINTVNPSNVVTPYILYKEIYFKGILHKYVPYENIGFHIFFNKPKTLERNDIFNLVDLNYIVAEKTDGEATLCIHYEDRIYEINSKNKIINEIKYKGNNKKSILSIYVGESVTKINKLYIFDVLYSDGKLMTQQKSFTARMNSLKKYPKKLHTKKIFYPIKDIKKVHDKSYEYDTDGLILVESEESYYSAGIYKWKPPEKLTCDFYIHIPQDSNQIYLYTQAPYGYFKYKLKFIYDKANISTIDIPYIITIKADNRTHNLGLFIIEPDDKYFKIQIKPNTIRNNKESTSYIYNSIKFSNGDILECSWDAQKGWIPYRKREDKILPNAFETAYSIMNTLVNPITIKDLRSPENILLNSGYWVKSLHNTSKLKKFHNGIKYKLFKKIVTEPKLNLLDIAGGHANDLGKWIMSEFKKVTIIERDSEAIEEGKKRIEEKKNIPFYTKYIKGDLIKNIRKITKKLKGESIVYDITTLFFAIHYFMGSKSTIENIVKMIDAVTEKDSFFILTSIDGQKIIDLFNAGENINENKDSLKEYSIRNGNIREFVIIKKYTGNKLKKYGQKIGVYIRSIGTLNDEYLVNLNVLDKLMKDYGFIQIERCHFDVCYNEEYKRLNEHEKLYSKLNQYTIYKKNI
ncbi:MAG: hypothetical protein ACOCRK_01200 [bacterium]